MSIDTLRDKYRDWFTNHDTAINSSISPGQKVIAGNKTFYLKRCLREDVPVLPYKMILGYVSTNNRLKCRLWFYSGSEANWRAFTGWREDGAWKKGAEGTSNKEEYSNTQMGYIYECYTTSEMSDHLLKYWDTNSGLILPDYRKIIPFIRREINGKTILVKNDIAGDQTLMRVWRYTAINEQSEIEKAYSSERKYSPITFPQALNGDIKKIVKSKNAVDIQREFKKSYFTGEMSGSGKRLSDNDELQSWLARCLDRPVDSKPPRPHDALNLDFVVERYRIFDGNNREIILEIACTTNNYAHILEIQAGTSRTVNTPVVWVKDAYYEIEETSSFGTRRNIPINLSFLVQKPCDYTQQVSGDYAIEGNGNNFIQAGFARGESLISSKYVILSYINEVTSPIVKEYKRRKGFVTFDPPPGNVNRVDLSLINIYILKQLVFYGISQYKSLRDRKSFDWGFHGDKGMQRADALYHAIKDSNDFPDFCRVLVNCFIHNRINLSPGLRLQGEPVRESFTGGFASGINTNRTSLFTCICRTLFNETSIPSNISSRLVDEHARDRTNAGGVYRMVYFIRNENNNNEDRDTFINANAAELLNRLRPLS